MWKKCSGQYRKTVADNITSFIQIAVLVGAHSLISFSISIIHSFDVHWAYSAEADSGPHAKFFYEFLFSFYFSFFLSFKIAPVGKQIKGGYLLRYKRMSISSFYSFRIPKP